MEKYIWAIPVNRHILPIEHPCPEQQYNTGCRARWQCKHIPPHSGFCCPNCATFLLVDERASSVLL